MLPEVFMIDTPKRALAIFAHPDDAEFGCAGAVAKWARQGTEVYYLACTRGDKGSNDPEMTAERLAPIREREQREAASVLGVREVVMLHYGDGELEDTRNLRRDIVRAVRRFRPDVVFTSNPFVNNRHIHRDHRVTGQVVLDGLFPYARDHLHFPELLREGLEPHKTLLALLWGAEGPDVLIDITETIDAKVEALMCHRSQFRGRANQVAERVRSWARETGQRAGVPYAEAFRKIQFRP